jgi:hypothetical protein
MTRKSVEAIVRALNDARVRYLMAGGLAVVAHGHVRFTADVDIVLDMDRDNVLRATGALSALGYRPRAPVRIEELADPAMRGRWVQEKGLTVFSLFSTTHPATEVDLFVESPLDFESAFKRSLSLEVAPGVKATFVGIHDLIDMKRAAGRQQDIEDVERLEALIEDEEPGDG